MVTSVCFIQDMFRKNSPCCRTHGQLQDGCIHERQHADYAWCRHRPSSECRPMTDSARCCHHSDRAQFWPSPEGLIFRGDRWCFGADLIYGVVSRSCYTLGTFHRGHSRLTVSERISSFRRHRALQTANVGALARRACIGVRLHKLTLQSSLSCKINSRATATPSVACMSGECAHLMDTTDSVRRLRVAAAHLELIRPVYSMNAGRAAVSIYFLLVLHSCC